MKKGFGNPGLYIVDKLISSSKLNIYFLTKTIFKIYDVTPYTNLV